MNSEDKIKLFFKRSDPVIYAVLHSVDLSKWRKQSVNPEEYFNSLVNQILSQQLSTKVADVISNRLQALIGERPFVPTTFLGIEDDEFRAVGLSRAKVSYIKNLAVKILENELQLETLSVLTEEEVIAELTKIKGIGKWTAEMFLMFTLGKDDVFSHGDWGLKTAMKNLYSLPDYPTQVEAEKITEKWRPYRSYGSFALWESLDKKG